MRWTAIVLTALLALFPQAAVANAQAAVTSPTAAADQGVDGGASDGGNGVVIVDVDLGGGKGSTVPVGGSGGATDKERTCRFGDREIDCESQFGVWDGSCYVEVADPQPSKDDAAWGEHEDGVIMVCMPYVCVPQPGQDTIPVADCPGRSVYWAPPGAGRGCGSCGAGPACGRSNAAAADQDRNRS